MTNCNRRTRRSRAASQPAKRCDMKLKTVGRKSQLKSAAPIRAAPRVGRNSPCPCGSGQKYKKCCGRPTQSPIQPRGSIYKNMAAQYNDEQQKAADDFLKQWGFVSNPAQLLVFMEGDNKATTDMVVQGIHDIGGNEHFAYAATKLGHLITRRNQYNYDELQKQQWLATLAEYEQQCRADAKSDAGPPIDDTQKQEWLDRTAEHVQPRQANVESDTATPAENETQSDS